MNKTSILVTGNRRGLIMGISCDILHRSKDLTTKGTNQELKLTFKVMLSLFVFNSHLNIKSQAHCSKAN